MLDAVVNEAGHLLSLDWYRQNGVALLNIIMIDLMLAGDNAIVVGLAASRVAPEMRAKVIFWGIAAAVVLRIFFAAITCSCCHHRPDPRRRPPAAVGLLEDVPADHLQRGTIDEQLAPRAATAAATARWVLAAVWTHHPRRPVDVARQRAGGRRRGQGLDARAGDRPRHRDHSDGGRLAFIARLVKYPWITWIGLFIIFYVALDMIYAARTITCQALQRRLLGDALAGHPALARDCRRSKHPCAGCTHAGSVAPAPSAPY